MSGMKIVLIVVLVLALLVVAASAATAMGKSAFSREGEKVLAGFMVGANKDLQAGGADAPPFTKEDLQDLPLPVQQWMHNAGVVGKPPIHTVYIEQ